ncbi:hypothetical protein BB934_26465 [Microvirga ossetica]|uniref:Response regulatory domain-containing protein n=1 Tax=Microvirga ossetica TaxID=1882682 RepID=A0A1B2EMX0_9HYPH|nr:response regulator [Microvirga ossetica]ANY81328.1 hypothetical protein BB934_26465 [Microvirga ossetica]
MTRILIADDHDVVRSGVRAILEGHEGWEVVGEARDGKEAIDRALATPPDVVVLDYALPEFGDSLLTPKLHRLASQIGSQTIPI